MGTQYVQVTGMKKRSSLNKSQSSGAGRFLINQGKWLTSGFQVLVRVRSSGVLLHSSVTTDNGNAVYTSKRILNVFIKNEKCLRRWICLP